MEQTARELVRALRGNRSQVAFSRRLGYRSNVAADWEQGRRSPTAEELVRAAGTVGVDVRGAMANFAPAVAVPDELDAEGLAQWLNALRGSRAITRVARDCDRSRHAVGRWLSGTSQPRVADWLRVIDALTGRVTDLLDAMGVLEQLPSVVERARRIEASRRVGIDNPWSLAVLIALESDAYTALGEHSNGWLEEHLDLGAAQVGAALDQLVQAGVIQWQTDRFRVHGSLTIDTRSHPDARDRLRRHWSAVAAERAQDPRSGDVVSYNLFGASRADLERIADLQRAMFREVRSIVAASSPVQTVGLIHYQTLAWPLPTDSSPLA